MMGHQHILLTISKFPLNFRQKYNAHAPISIEWYEWICSYRFLTLSQCILFVPDSISHCYYFSGFLFCWMLTIANIFFSNAQVHVCKYDSVNWIWRRFMPRLDSRFFFFVHEIFLHNSFFQVIWDDDRSL